MSENEKPDFVNGLREAVRENPVSAALVGIGLAWMFLGGSRITAAAALAGSTAHAASEGVERAANAAGRAASSATETITSATHRAAERAGEYAASAADRDTGRHEDANHRTTAASGEGSFSPMMTGLKSTLERQPLLLGGIGLALGGVIAAALPQTQLETDVAGDVSDRVTGQMTEFATDAADRLKNAASRASGAIMNEAEVQGLTVEGAKAGASALKEKVVQAAAAAAGAKGS